MALQIFDVVLLIISLVVVLFGAEFFTNGIEWLGFKLKLSEGATGSILAAVGTAMPETMIPIVALLFGSTAEVATEVGIGAILGAPFMLATLAMFVGGSTIVISTIRGKREAKLELDERIMKLDLRFFLIVYLLAIVPAVMKIRVLNYVVVVALVGCYIWYIRHILSEMEPIGASHSRLYLDRLVPRGASSNSHPHEPHIALVALQVFIALAVIVLGARIFVASIEDLTHALGVSAAILSFVIAPIATELPEKFNSIIWYSRKQDTLAMGNVTGAMVFQSSLLPALGIAITPWVLEMSEIASMLGAISSAGVLYAFVVKKKLSGYVMLLGGFFYVVFILLHFAFV